MRLTVGVLSLLVLILADATCAQDAAPETPTAEALDVHNPEAERRSFQLLHGFDVNLWAAEPMLANPVHMTWDPLGRLWVCCAPSYPHVKPGEDPNDYIVVIEDTDNDGRADKSTVFADGLYVPTGLELGDGGVYVANAPDLLFLKDTDGDLKADVREIVLTGFATEDNHHSISAWRWGPGGWLYFQEGTFMHSQVETPHGVVRLENGGVFRFRPRDLKLEVFADYRASNPWGHMFDEWGESIVIDNPNLYFSAPLTANSRAKLGYQPSLRASTKNCGGEFVSGRHLPEEFRGQLWTNQYKAHQVARFQPIRDGSGMTFKELEPLLRSKHDSFRPVDLKMGPDGAVYVLDWYNPLIGHMQHSFRDKRRDTTHGRVWRITYPDRPLVKKPEFPLPGNSIEGLVARLGDPEGWTRHQVKRVLSEMPPQRAASALNRFLAKLDPKKHSNFEHIRLEVLWAFQTIDVVNEDLLYDVLDSPDYRVRTAGLRVLRDWQDRVQLPLRHLKAAVQDDHPRVRLEAVLTCGFVPDAESVGIACLALDKPTDRYIDHALRLTVDGLQKHWLAAHRAGKEIFLHPQHRDFALSNLVTSEAVDALVNQLNAGHVDVASVRAPAAAVAKTATAPQLEKLVLTLVEHVREFRTRGREATDPEAITIVLNAMAEATRQRGAVPNSGSRLIPRCFDVPNAGTQIAAARLAGLWKLKNVGKRLQNLINAKGTVDDVKSAAAVALGRIGGKAERTFLLSLCISKRTPRERFLGATGLAEIDLELASTVAAEVLADDLRGADPSRMIDAFTGRQGGADQLAAALSETDVNADAARLILEHFVRTGEQHPGLVKALGGEIRVGSLEDLLLKEDAKALAAAALTDGDAERGEAIFRRKSLACLSCHGIMNAGSRIGPDLGTIGSGAQPDYLVDSFLRPSKVIKEFFETVVILTTDGRLVNGILVSSNDDEVVIRDPQRQGEEASIARSRIDAMRKGKSLMPTGLANKLKNRQEFLDLVKFITQLGRPGPYATSVEPVIRRWRVLPTASFDSIGPAEQIRVTVKNGSPAYSRVDGRLPMGELPPEFQEFLLVAEIDVQQGGAVRLSIEGVKPTGIYFDGGELKQAADMTVRPGRHTIGILIRDFDAGASLRAKLTAVDGTAQFRIVGGR